MVITALWHLLSLILVVTQGKCNDMHVCMLSLLSIAWQTYAFFYARTGIATMCKVSDVVSYILFVKEERATLLPHSHHFDEGLVPKCQHATK